MASDGRASADGRTSHGGGSDDAHAGVSHAGNAHLVEITKIEARVKIAKYAFIGLGILAAGWLLQAPLIAMAGRETKVGISANAEATVDATAQVNWFLAAALAVSLVANAFLFGLARSQRGTLERTVQHLAPTLAELEMRIDPERSGSGLTRQGRTNPRDH